MSTSSTNFQPLNISSCLHFERFIRKPYIWPFNLLLLATPTFLSQGILSDIILLIIISCSFINFKHVLMHVVHPWLALNVTECVSTHTFLGFLVACMSSIWSLRFQISIYLSFFFLFFPCIPDIHRFVVEALVFWSFLTRAFLLAICCRRTSKLHCGLLMYSSTWLP